MQKTRRKAYHPFVKAARLIYIPERDHTFPATSPERPFYGFSVAGMNIAAYCASRLREVGFEAVFDPGTPVSEEKGEIIEVSMHDFSPEAAIWLAFCGAGEARSEEGHLLARKSGENGLTRVFTRKEAAIERLVYPWDLLEWQERVMEKMEWEDFSGCALAFQAGSKLRFFGRRVNGLAYILVQQFVIGSVHLLVAYAEKYVDSA